MFRRYNLPIPWSGKESFQHYMKSIPWIIRLNKLWMVSWMSMFVSTGHNAIWCWCWRIMWVRLSAHICEYGTQRSMRFILNYILALIWMNNCSTKYWRVCPRTLYITEAEQAVTCHCFSSVPRPPPHSSLLTTPLQVVRGRGDWTMVFVEDPTWLVYGGDACIVLY